MGMTSLSIILTVVVLNLHYRGSSDVRPPQRFCNAFQRTRHSRASGASYAGSPAGETAGTNDTVEALTPDSLMVKLKRELAGTVASGDCDVDRRHVTCIAYQPDTINREPPFLAGRDREATSDDVVAALKRIISRYDRDCDVAEREQATKEWRQLARSVDKLLFWVFLCAHIGVTGFVLVVLPLTKPV